MRWGIGHLKLLCNLPGEHAKETVEVWRVDVVEKGNLNFFKKLVGWTFVDLKPEVHRAKKKSLPK